MTQFRYVTVKLNIYTIDEIIKKGILKSVSNLAELRLGFLSASSRASSRQEEMYRRKCIELGFECKKEMTEWI